MVRCYYENIKKAYTLQHVLSINIIFSKTGKRGLLPKQVLVNIYKSFILMYLNLGISHDREDGKISIPNISL